MITSKLQTGTESWNSFLSESKGRRGKGITHTQIERSGFSKSERLKQIGAEVVQDSKETIWGGVAGYKIEARRARVEWEPTACRRSSSQRERDAARSGCDSRTWGVLGSWNEGLSRDWTWWRLDGWGTIRPRRKEGEWGEEPSLAITAIFFFKIYLCISALCLDKKGWKYNLCTLYMNSYIFHICFMFFIFLSNTYLTLNFYMLDVIIGRYTWILSPYR